MRRGKFGFTLVEMVFVIFIGTILTMVAMGAFQRVQTSFAARGAKTMYATLHQRARARAIEMGQSVLLVVDTDGDSAYMRTGATVSDVTSFRRALNVDLRATPSVFTICMTPRGYADTSCPGLPGTSTTTSAITLEFWQSADSSSIVILPMGQLVGL
jgi:prepilin-type N-terminal cleavage/methylation domain-containing protein